MKTERISTPKPKVRALMMGAGVHLIDEETNEFVGIGTRTTGEFAVRIKDLGEKAGYEVTNVVFVEKRPFSKKPGWIIAL